LVLPKPKSANDAVRREIKRQFPCHQLTRKWAENPAAVVRTFRKHGILTGRAGTIFIDIGGYFAESLSEICKKAGGQVIGVIEGTENGLLNYEKRADRLPVPVYTVARSPLKYPENYLIGVSVVFSIESILRSTAQVLQSQRACVIGFGKVGRSIAGALRDHGVPTVVYDHSPIALAEAAARGFQIFRSPSGALRDASLVVGATGSKSLDTEGFANLKDGAYVASVTSGDDELELSALDRGYAQRRTGRHTQRFSDGSKSFTLLNGGNAVNFVHGAVVGPAIQLIEGEKLACITELASRRRQPPGIYELATPARQRIAEIWLDHFGSQE
jgi:adenosylhomocysteinase